VSDTKQSGNGAARPGQAAELPIFYRQPRPLDAQRDQRQALKAAPDFGFARGTNSVVLNGPEFPHAARSYPIVFTASEPRAAVAVLGLADNENLFIREDGAWLADTYIPAYVRRYPFILMEQAASNELVLCIDEASGLLSPEGERKLFENGEPAKLVRDALAFCGEFHQHHRATGEFARALAAQGLLAPNEARVVMNTGRQLTLRGFEVIDEAKFNALPDEVFLDWRRRGWLPLVYCHFLSMANWAKLVELEGKRSAAKPPA
jgi:SapC